jgi:cell division protein FtsB
MSVLFKNRFLIRQNLLTLMGLCLCLYFSYHALQGHRSIGTLLSLERQIETLSQKNDILLQEKLEIEQKVAMMRPGSVNKDLLEEQSRLILGYRHKDELAVSPSAL